MARSASLLSRRRFLAVIATTAATAILAACSGSKSSFHTTPAPATIPQPTAIVSPSLTAPFVTPTPADERTAIPSSSPIPEPPPAATIAWLRANAVPFTTTQPGDDFTDLMFLKEIVGDARIIALGEATHGTHEFFQMKHRLLEFFVTQMGFNTFAMEANLPESDRINDYVQTGNGNPEELLTGLYFWTWRTQEVLDMIRWMQAHNASPGATPRIAFRGFDLQFISVAVENVLKYLRTVDPPAAVTAESRYNSLPGPARPNQDLSTPLYKASAVTQTAFFTNVQTVYNDLGTTRDQYTMVSTPEAFAYALQNARVAVQGVDVIVSGAHKDYTKRDQYMAENAGWLLDQAGPGAKIVLWAHNEHVSAEPSATTVANVVTDTMGTWLRRRYGSAMRVFGFDFYQGTCNAINGMLGEFVVPPPTADSYEVAFHQINQPRFILDLRGIQPGNAATDWLQGSHRLRSIGAVYDDADPDKYFQHAHLPRRYDAVIYFEDTTPSLLPPLT